MTKDVQDLMHAVERVRDDLHRALWTDPDPDGLVGLADPACEVSITPAGSGAAGTDALHRFAADLARPADLAFRRLSRTGDRWQVVDEERVSFTHDRELPWLVPGVAATHRSVEVDVITLVTVRRHRVTRYRAVWDQLGVLTALGLTSTGLTSTGLTSTGLA